MYQGNVQTAVDQANLLSGVRNDIESVLPCRSLLPELVYSIPKFLSSAYKSSAAEALLAERGRIDSSHQMIDATLEYALDHGFFLLLRLIDDGSQARETRSEFARQRSSLGAIQTRMVGVLSP